MLLFLTRPWSGPIERNLCAITSGQFSREPEVRVYDIGQGVDPLKMEATMEVKGNRLHVTR